MYLPPNRKVLEKRIVNATGYDSDHWNSLLYRYTAHKDIITLLLDSPRSVPSLVCKARNKSAYEIEATNTMTEIANAFDSMIDDITSFYGDWEEYGFTNYICRV